MLIQSATTIVQESFDPSQDARNVIDKAERSIFDIGQDQIEGKAYAMSDIIHNTMETIDQLFQRKEHVTGLATGFHELTQKRPLTFGFDHYRGTSLHG